MTTAKQLSTPTGRAKLEARGKPHFVTIVPGLAIGYRRNEGAGRWIARWADGKGGNATRGFAYADDQVAADGVEVMTYDQALEQARRVAQGTTDRVSGPLTVSGALDEYETALRARGGLAGNASRVRHHLRSRAMVALGLAEKDLAALTARDLAAFQAAVPGAKETVNRTVRVFKAVLNRAFELDQEGLARLPGIMKAGFKPLKNVRAPRDVYLEPDQVRDLVEGARQENGAIGLFVEVGAVSGARPSQIVRLTVGDLKLGDKPVLMMPVSNKGNGEKLIAKRPVSISTDLADRLARSVARRGKHELLLRQESGRPWTAKNGTESKSGQVQVLHADQFARAVENAGLDPEQVTFYWLRHTNIQRMIKLGVPTKIIADMHDTSTKEIERTYAHALITRADEIIRPAMLNLDPVVVPFRTAA